MSKIIGPTVALDLTRPLLKITFDHFSKVINVSVYLHTYMYVGIVTSDSARVLGVDSLFPMVNNLK